MREMERRSNLRCLCKNGARNLHSILREAIACTRTAHRMRHCLDDAGALIAVHRSHGHDWRHHHFHPLFMHDRHLFSRDYRHHQAEAPEDRVHEEAGCDETVDHVRILYQ